MAGLDRNFVYMCFVKFWFTVDFTNVSRFSKSSILYQNRWQLLEDHSFLMSETRVESRDAQNDFGLQQTMHNIVFLISILLEFADKD